MPGILQNNHHDIVGDVLVEPVLSAAASEAQVGLFAKEKLGVRSDDAQRIRRDLLRGARVLIVQAGYQSKRFIYERLHELGVQLTILDAASHWSKALVAEGVAAHFIDVEPLPFEDLYERSMAAVAAAGLTFDGVITYWDEAVPLANRLGAAVGVPCNGTQEACDTARNKGRTREVLARAGVPSSRYARVFAADDLPAAAAHVGFPAVIKPVFGAASRGVVRVDSVPELLAAYAEQRALCTADVDPIWAQGTEYVLEEYYDGDEVDMDVLLSDGEVVFCKVSDNWPCQKPYYQETGENAPSLLPASKVAELEALAVDSLRAMGFQRGVFHVEAKYTSRGPRLVEVNPRMGGMGVRDVYLLAYGVDFVEEHAMAMVGIPIRPVIPAEPRPVAMFFINAPYSGVVGEGEDWLAPLRGLPRVYSARRCAAAGARVTGPERGVPTTIGEVIVWDDRSVQSAIAHVRALVATLRCPVIPDDPAAACGLFFPSGFPVDVPEEEGGAALQ